MSNYLQIPCAKNPLAINSFSHYRSSIPLASVFLEIPDHSMRADTQRRCASAWFKQFFNGCASKIWLFKLCLNTVADHPKLLVASANVCWRSIKRAKAAAKFLTIQWTCPRVRRVGLLFRKMLSCLKPVEVELGALVGSVWCTLRLWRVHSSRALSFNLSQVDKHVEWSSEQLAAYRISWCRWLKRSVELSNEKDGWFKRPPQSWQLTKHIERIVGSPQLQNRH